MDITEVKEKLSAAGIQTIQIEGSASRDSARGLVFIGSFEEYLTALQCVGAGYVFQVVECLEEEDFLYSPDSVDLDEEEEIDLADVKPELKKFKTYIGQQCRYKLFTPITNGTLDYYNQAEWWAEFEELSGAAIESIDEDKEKVQEQIQEAKSQREEKIIKDIQSLIKDKNFISLPTQRAMIEFAKENVHSANELDSYTLRDEIRTLDAKIKAKRISSK